LWTFELGISTQASWRLGHLRIVVGKNDLEVLPRETIGLFDIVGFFEGSL
jgi:hypothetical protein